MKDILYQIYWVAVAVGGGNGMAIGGHNHGPGGGGGGGGGAGVMWCCPPSARGITIHDFITILCHVGFSILQVVCAYSQFEPQ